MKFPTQCPLVLQVHVNLREGKAFGNAKDSVMKNETKERS
jgi:hypothetical protein